MLDTCIYMNKIITRQSNAPQHLLYLNPIIIVNPAATTDTNRPLSRSQLLGRSVFAHCDAGLSLSFFVAADVRLCKSSERPLLYL